MKTADITNRYDTSSDNESDNDNEFVAMYQRVKVAIFFSVLQRISE